METGSSSLSSCNSSSTTFLPLTTQQLWQEPWFPKGVPWKPISILRALASFLRVDTESSVLLRVFHYLQLYCRWGGPVLWSKARPCDCFLVSIHILWERFARTILCPQLSCGYGVRLERGFKSRLRHTNDRKVSTQVAILPDARCFGVSDRVG